MRNISKIQRLISGFKRQNRQTVLSHLDTMADDPVVFSKHLKGIAPHLKSNDIYLYIDHWCIVVVCLDCIERKDELADEERFNGDPPLYFTESSYRISPVWLLSQTMKQIEEKLTESNISLHMRGVLLSKSSFINADDMKEIWEEMNVTVIDKLEMLSSETICVNEDDDNLNGTMVMDALKDLMKRPEQKSEAEQEFVKMLDEFMSSNVADTKEKENKVEADDIEEDDKQAEDLPGDNSSNLELPSDIIEQNNNLSVKVKILPPMENPRAELDKLVGCQDIRNRIDELLAMTRYNKMIRRAFPDAKLHEVSLHSVFYGRPGTGKTTVCKIFGSLLHEAGALSKGHVVVADRGTFIGTLWGDEERSVRQVLEIAQGGVLMIDEAYLLNGKHENDPGKLVIPLLMQVLADESQRDIAIVLCGYKEPLSQLIKSNIGLDSRFPNRFEFCDFTIDELMEITRRRIGEYKYRFTRQAWQKYKNMLTTAYKSRDKDSWGNARFVSNQLERIYIKHALRCVKENTAEGEKLLTLTPADISPIEVPQAKPRIGF